MTQSQKMRDKRFHDKAQKLFDESKFSPSEKRNGMSAHVLIGWDEAKTHKEKVERKKLAEAMK